MKIPSINAYRHGRVHDYSIMIPRNTLITLKRQYYGQ